jgi:hypothetical protein
MAKRMARSQTANLIPDRKKQRIDPIYLVVKGMQHTVGKLLTRNTTLLRTASQFEVFLQSYGAPKLRESQLVRFWDSHSGVPREKSHLDVGSVAKHRIYYKGGRWWLPPSPGRGESNVSVLPVARPNTKGAPIMH